MPSDLALFLRQLARNPVQTSAIVPSSAFLARAMVAGLGDNSGRVVEFGPGTGTLTDGILATGLAPEMLTLIELDPVFVGHLQARLPGVTVLQTGADTAAAHVAGGVARVVSGLPLLSMPRALREAIVAAAFAILAPDGVFVQFSYGEAPALDPAQLTAMGLVVTKGRKVWLNLPPARVYYYRRA